MPRRTRSAGATGALALFLLLGCRAGATELTLVYTGETHAMISPCRCVVSREGGVARRAAAIAEVRRDGLTPTLVLDAGGQFGGSAYDEYAEGPQLDRERTRVHLRACREIGYAAYAIGDEELMFGLDFLREAGELGGAPFLSANLDEATLNAVGGKRFLVQDVGGVRIGVTALTTPDLYALPSPLLPEGASVGDPQEGLRALLPALRGQCDIVVVLSHLGSDRTRAIAEAVAGVDIFVNAHYRRPGGLIDRVNGALVCEFNMEARALSRLDLSVEGGEIREYRLREIPLDAKVEDDIRLARTALDYEDGRDALGGPRVLLDYYTAWGCHYCSEFEPELREAVERFGPGRVELRRWHAVHRSPTTGEFVSMFGPEAVAEARRSIAIERLRGAETRERYYQLRYLQPDAAPEAALGALGLDAAEVAIEAASPEVERALDAHRERNERFGIAGTPMLYINNLAYDADMAAAPLLRTFCGLMPEALKGEWCAGVPDCVSDADCRQSGKIGRCVGAGTPEGRCEFVDPPPLTVTVLTSPDVKLSPPRRLLGNLASLFPGLETRTVERASEEGQQLAQSASVRWLPAFFFPSAELDLRPNRSSLDQVIQRVGEWYAVLPVPENTGLGGLDTTRPRDEGKLDVFYRVADPAALESVATVLDLWTSPRVHGRFRLDLHPMLFLNESGALAAEGGVAEIEEAARQSVVWQTEPEKMLAYAGFRRQAGNSTYWDVPLRLAGLDPDAVRARATAGAMVEKLYADARMAEDAAFYGECVLLYANQELADISSVEKVADVANRIGLAPGSVTLLYTGNINGQLEACRCPGNPYGGLARQAEAIAELREMHPGAIVLDAGDMLAGDQEARDFGYLQRGLASIGYDAVAIGEQDFSLGIDVLRGLATASPTPYTSANLSLPELPGGARVIEREGVRVGLVSLTSPRAFPEGLPEGAVLAEPLATARRCLSELATAADFSICLYHGPLDEARQLASDCPGFGAILCGHEGASLQVPERIGDTWLLAAGRNGEWVGRLTLELDADARPTEGDAQLIAMDDQIADHPDVAKVIAEYQVAVQGSLQTELAALAEDPLSSVAACGSCHQAELEQWQSTPHAQAAETLRRLDREFSPACWDCHSSEPLTAGTRRLPDVTCVSCHRVDDARADGHGAVAPVTPAHCLPCHTEAKSPHFVWETYEPRVRHE